MSAHPMPLFAVLALALGVATQAAAANPPAQTGRRLPARVSFIEAPSSEKPAAREKRLKRECRGRPNAGMCLGYTR